MKIDFLEGKCIQYELVGSRITCDPAPTGTDQDVLVLTTPHLWRQELEPMLLGAGYTLDGSDCGNQAEYMEEEELSFQSYKLDDLNLIITFHDGFYQRFMAATKVAKKLNLLDKDDRVMLFQAVLYGNPPPVPFEEIEFPEPKEYVRSWWVEFENKTVGCIEALNHDEVRLIAARVIESPIVEISKLPYPAEPRLNVHDDHNGHGPCPSFCWKPHQCKGSSACPQSYSCTE